MEMLLFTKLSSNAFTPVKATAQSAGYDLRSAYDCVVNSRDKQLVKTDIAIRVPDGCYGRIAPRSGLALHYHIDIGAGVIDRDYRGNVGVVIFNHSPIPFLIKKGDRIAQLICERIVEPKLQEVTDLNITERGNRGFGSTGVTVMETSTAVPSTSTSSPTIFYSLLELVQIIYIGGITSIVGWETMLCNLKKIILDESDPLINIYFILFNAVSNFLLDEVSQVSYYKLKDAILTFDELITYFGQQINEEHLNTKSISSDLVKRFKELIKKSGNEIDKIEITIHDSESDTDIGEGEEDSIEKAFESVFPPKKSNNTRFEQSFHLQANDEKKWLKTPGEEGRYLIEVKVTDTHDLKKVPAEDWWKKIHKKAIFLASSPQDPLYIKTNKILKNALEKISKIKNVSKGKFSMSTTRFKPY